MTPRKPRTRTAESGVAAIEFAIVLPVLLLLFFGMINLTSYITMVRKASSAAELLADLVTRHNATIANADLDDYIAGAILSFRPSATTGVNVEVYNYFRDGAATKTRWQKPAAADAACTAPLTTSPEIATLLPAGDVIVAVVCIPGYALPVDYPGIPQLGAIQKVVALSPRHSTTLMLQ